MKPRLILVAATLLTTLIGRAGTPANLIDDSWETAAARDEIRPEFAFDPHGGRGGSSSLEIFSDTREGLSGYWFKTVPVHGGDAGEGHPS